MSLKSEADVLQCLCTGRSLGDVGLPMNESRVLVEGLSLSNHAAGSYARIPLIRTAFVQGSRGRRLKGKLVESVEFRSCDVSGLQLLNSAVVNCNFVKCKLERLFLYRSRVENCTFIECSLRETAFGGNSITTPVHPNEYRKVDFDRCDFTASAHGCGLYTECTFRNCRFRTTFPGAVFTNCVFEGALDDVIFHGRNLDFPKMPSNVMAGCDLSKADLSSCRFVDMSLDPSIFGDNPDVLILWHGPEDWRRWFEDGHIERTEGNRNFVEIMMEGNSRPDVTSRSSLAEMFTRAEIDALEAISRKAV